jgi:EAL domain-containing protein (putative c-di-GMP-specific phosphodiesterase class I)
MGLLIVSEGVETSAELSTLIDLGCDLFQGYLFARPGRAFPEPQWPAAVPDVVTSGTFPTADSPRPVSRKPSPKRSAGG